MNNLKWILRTITICCAILPLLFTVLAYQDNLLGVLVPEQLIAVMSGNDQALQAMLPDLSNMSNVEPTFNDDFHFNPDDGTFGLSLNVTSPVDTPITFGALSLTVTDDNGTILGTINLGHPVTIGPDTNSTIPIEGTVSPALMTLIQNSGIDPTDPHFTPEQLEGLGLVLDDLHVTNVDIDIGGIQIHIDELNLDELLGSQASGSAEDS